MAISPSHIGMACARLLPLTVTRVPNRSRIDDLNMLVSLQGKMGISHLDEPGSEYHLSYRQALVSAKCPEDANELPAVGFENALIRQKR